VIRLEQNYRSHRLHILAAANALIAHNKKRLGKNLWTSAGHGEPVRIYEAQSDGYEASWLAEEVQAVKRAALRLADIGVLSARTRSRASSSTRFSRTAAHNRGVRGPRFFERMEIKHALGVLRLAANRTTTGFPARRQLPCARIGARSLETLQDAARPAMRAFTRRLGLARKKRRGARHVPGLVESLKAETQGCLPRNGRGDARKERTRCTLQGRKRRRRPGRRT